MTSMPLTFLHGWGQSRQIWHHQHETFRDAVFLDLPGHGGAPASGDWLPAIADQLPEAPGIVVGWSLGGMLAMQLAAAHPQRVRALVLVGTTPRFCADATWPHGCPASLLDDFRAGVETASAKTMSRFFALMLHGDGLARAGFNAIARAAVDRRRPADEEMLRHGLELLAKLDLRSELVRIGQPALVMHGENDTVIPSAAGRYLADRLPHGEWQPFAGCGHAPFLTQPERFNERLEAWCRNIS